MSTRAPAHAEEEKAIFDAFLVAHPSFEALIKRLDQPDAPFPDVVVELLAGGFIDFELGEWLDGPQIGAAKRYDAVAEAITAAIGPQSTNPSPHFRAVMLCPRDGVTKFEAADRAAFRTEFWRLVAETHHRWPSERFWRSPQGRICSEFDRYPVMGTYLRSVHFDPRVVGGKERRWPAGQPWVFVENRGGAYSPDTSLAALRAILTQKTTHYGAFARPTRLIIYYGKAAVYNTPYIGVGTHEFADVAAWAADVVRGQAAFEKIYLLNALEPGLEAVEIYPGLRPVHLMSIVPADPERAVRFDVLERAIRTFYAKTWADWYREVPAATPATLVIQEGDHTSLYRPKRDTICLYVTEHQFDEDAADALPWPTWKVELVHEMIHEWEHKALASPTAAGSVGTPSAAGPGLCPPPRPAGPSAGPESRSGRERQAP